ncbi:MAG: bacteriohemerythrin, partial [Gammaproteobacteria bacterium]
MAAKLKISATDYYMQDFACSYMEMPMAFFEWEEKYSVSVPSIDRQHRDLIDYINKLQVELASSEPDTLMIELILNGLIGYTNTHFKYEEMLFSMYKYPETEQHKAAHNRLFESV